MALSRERLKEMCLKLASDTAWIKLGHLDGREGKDPDESFLRCARDHQKYAYEIGWLEGAEGEQS